VPPASWPATSKLACHQQAGLPVLSSSADIEFQIDTAQEQWHTNPQIQS
jgi:hypothetical protein